MKTRNGKNASRRRSTGRSFEKVLHSDCSSATASLSDDSSTSSITQPPIRHTKPQHEKLKSTKCKRKRTPKKSGKKKATTTVVEVEKLTEEEKAQYVGLDCEMVGTGQYGETSALARVSIVNWDGDVIFDTFVKVEEEVTDYRTFVSGVRETDVESGIDFDECQERVKEILHGKTIVGHALKNDFYALNLTHPWHQIRDTARYDPFMKKSKTCEKLLPKKLKVLAKDKLGMIIQEDGKEHCSVEDATAAMELYKKARRKWEIAVEWKMNKTAEIVTLQVEEAHEFYSSEENPED